MKVVCTIGSQGLSDGRRFSRGDVYEVDDETASTLILNGYAEECVIEEVVVDEVVDAVVDVVVDEVVDDTPEPETVVDDVVDDNAAPKTPEKSKKPKKNRR